MDLQLLYKKLLKKQILIIFQLLSLTKFSILEFGINKKDYK